MTIIMAGEPAHRQRLALNPSWKAELLKRPLVEVRRGFSLGYDAPSEDASTIILTAPSGKYVDIRFSTLPQASADSQVTQQVTQQLGKIHGYATAGLSTAFSPAKQDANCPPYDCLVHMQWEHTIDSSNSFATDGADMILLANGDRIEAGFMDVRGTVKYFKEYWVSPPGRATELPCIVAELDAKDTKGAVHGMAMRIGDFCQGILQTETEFWYERWEYGDEGHGWEKDARSNTPQAASSAVGLLPCWRMTEGLMEVGAAMELDGKTWTITEVISK